MNRLKVIWITSFTALLFISCNKVEVPQKNIVSSILNDTSSFYYLDVKNYPKERKELPIGVFDSGTGGLTVLDAIINYDKFDNKSKSPNTKGDNKRDFQNEGFIYFGDHANMPYGEYEANNNTPLLKEHIIKDVQFLLGNKYYRSPKSETFNSDKKQVKAIVIACNTATAYGKKDIEKFVEEANLGIKVIGVIGAAVRGALATINKNEDASIAVMATAGTVASMGYVESIKEQTGSLGYKGNIKVYQQAGIGLAGAVDGAKDYIASNSKIVRKDYRGPSFTHESAKIDKKILKRYNFDFSGSKMLFSGNKEKPDELQINSIENYISYHVVSLIEQIVSQKNSSPLRTVILGCTHYPFYLDVFKKKFTELYNYQENGKYIYRNFLDRNVNLIDPAENTSKELYEYLNQENLFSSTANPQDEFYISQPNVLSTKIEVTSAGDFTYGYKYGRQAGMDSQFVKCIPFSKNNISSDVIEMLSNKIPRTFQSIQVFDKKSKKTEYLLEKEKL